MKLQIKSFAVLTSFALVALAPGIGTYQATAGASIRTLPRTVVPMMNSGIASARQPGSAMSLLGSWGRTFGAKPSVVAIAPAAVLVSAQKTGIDPCPVCTAFSTLIPEYQKDVINYVAGDPFEKARSWDAYLWIILNRMKIVLGVEIELFDLQSRAISPEELKGLFPSVNLDELIKEDLKKFPPGSKFENGLRSTVKPWLGPRINLVLTKDSHILGFMIDWHTVIRVQSANRDFAYYPKSRFIFDSKGGMIVEPQRTM